MATSSSKEFQIFVAGMLQSLECMMLTSLRLVELERWPPLPEFTTNEVTLHTCLQACFLILLQVTRQRKAYRATTITEANGNITHAVIGAPLKNNDLTLMRFFKMLPEKKI
jgi:hypothetical protein